MRWPMCAPCWTRRRASGPIGMQVIFAKGRVVFIADTSVTEMPTADQLADIAVPGRGGGAALWPDPRVALLASSTFGFPRSERSERIIEAVQILESRGVDFEYDGEMAVDVALDKDKLALYPFARITDTANVLIMPAIHSRLDLHQAAAADGLGQRDGADAGGAGKIGADRAPWAPR